MKCGKCGSETPIGHRCIVDDLDAIRNADLSDHPLTQAIKSAAPDSTPTEREARVRFPKSVGNATVDMETIQPTEREAGDVGEVAAVLARAYYENPRAALGDYADAEHFLRAAAALAPMIAERERAAGARALREAAEDYFTLMTRTEPGGTPEWLRERADALAPEPD